MTNTNRKHNRQEFFERICSYKAAHDGRNPSYREMASWYKTSTAVITGMLGNLVDDGLLGFDGLSFYVIGGKWSYDPTN